jgi:hypothetical protein
MVRSLGSRGSRVLPPNSAIRGGAVHPRRWVYLPELAVYIGIWGYTVRVHKRLPKLPRFPEPRGLTELLTFGYRQLQPFCTLARFTGAYPLVQ